MECLDAHDEEEARENTLRDQVQNDEQRASHRAKSKETLGEIADPLLDDVVGDADSLALVVIIGVGYLTGYAQRAGMEGCLRNQTVREGKPEQSSNTGSQAKKEDIPVETCGLAQREFRSLCNEGRDWIWLAAEEDSLGDRFLPL